MKFPNHGPSASRMFRAKTDTRKADMWNLSTESGGEIVRKRTKLMIKAVGSV